MEALRLARQAVETLQQEGRISEAIQRRAKEVVGKGKEEIEEILEEVEGMKRKRKGSFRNQGDCEESHGMDRRSRKGDF